MKPELKKRENRSRIRLRVTVREGAAGARAGETEKLKGGWFKLPMQFNVRPDIRFWLILNIFQSGSGPDRFRPNIAILARFQPD